MHVLTINTINYIFCNYNYNLLQIALQYARKYATAQLLSARYDLNSYTFLVCAKYACPHLDLTNMICNTAVTRILHHENINI